MFLLIYGMPIPVIIVLSLTISVVWSYVMVRFKERKIAIAFFSVSIYIVLHFTLLWRTHSNYEVILTPFRIIGNYHPEMVRMYVMNAFLFLPTGITFPFVLHTKHGKGRYVVLVLFALLFSLFVECAQYFLELGTFEVDDIIMNVLGASVFGGISYNNFLRIEGKQFDNHKKMNSRM